LRAKSDMDHYGLVLALLRLLGGTGTEGRNLRRMADLLSRRDILMLLTGAAAALQLPAEPSSPLFFTNDEFRMLDTLTELIIPSDDHSPGARAAGVAAYIDRS